MLKSIQGKIWAQVCLRRGKWDGAQRCGAFGDGSNLRGTSPERHKGSWVPVGEGIRQARGLEWANQHWVKSLSDLTLDETQDGRSNSVTGGVCAWPFSYSSELYQHFTSQWPNTLWCQWAVLKVQCVLRRARQESVTPISASYLRRARMCHQSTS